MKLPFKARYILNEFGWLILDIGLVLFLIGLWPLILYRWIQGKTSKGENRET